MKKIILLTMTILIALSAWSGVAATEQVWKQQTATKANKAWEISFNKPVHQRSVTSRRIYVENDKGKKVATTLKVAGDGMSVTVTPKNPYENKRIYRLHISGDLASKAGERLTNKIVMPFKIVLPSRFKKVEVNQGGVVTKVVVTVDGSVQSVKANGKAMHYLGKNTFEHGLVGIRTGDEIVLQAFDSSGKEIYKEPVIVK